MKIQYLSKELVKLLEKKLKILNSKRPLSISLINRLKERFEVEMTYNSNAIEGNSLTLKETFWVISEGITIKGKPLKDHLEAKNHKEALDYLYELVEYKDNQTISEHLIKNIHSLIIQDIDKRIAGKYREVDVLIGGSEHKPPSPFDIPRLMQELIKWAQDNIKKLHVVEFSALFHHKFVFIHPFIDGNGRTARLLMNIFLMQNGYPLTIILKNDRKKYYRVLEDADFGKYKEYITFIAQSVLRSLNLYLESILSPDKKENPLPLKQLAKHTRYSYEYLRKLARTGKIDAHKEKRNWLSSIEAIKNYEKEMKQPKK